MYLDPRIGVLNSGKFYCFPLGYHKPEVVGSLEEVEASLGLRPAPAPAEDEDAKEASSATAAPQPARAQFHVSAATKTSLVPKPREYLVTITPKVVTYAGSSTFSESTVRVSARTSAEAIKLVRQQRNQNEGRHGVSAIYRANLIEK